MAIHNLNLLETNLIKKNTVLDKLIALADKQGELLNADSIIIEDFDSCMDEQDALLEELMQLDDGFEQLCEKVAEELTDKANECTAQIEHIRQINQEHFNKSKDLQEKEASNKERLEQYFDKERKAIGSGRRSSKAAMDYYKSMSRSAIIPPQFMDQKK